MHGVKPLKPSDRHTNRPKRTKSTRKDRINHSHHDNHDIDIPSPRPHFSHHSAHCEGDESIRYEKPHVRPRDIKQLKKGSLAIGARLDLHCYTVDQAMEALDEFIHQSQQRSLRSVLIVHGKGNYSAGGVPIIKKMLNQYLREHPNVLAFHSAKPQDGGTGAVYVLLKSQG